MSDEMQLELIESFWDDEIDYLIDVYWNGKFGYEGFRRAKVMIENEWVDEYGLD